MNAQLEYALFRDPAPEPGTGRKWGPLVREITGPGLELRGNVVVKGADVYPLTAFVALRVAATAPAAPTGRRKRGSS